VRRFVRCLPLLLSASLGTAFAAEDPSVVTYSATYQVEYKGKDLGTSEFSVRYLADKDVYEFMSRTLAKGMLKLVTPNPVVERSQFRVENGRIVPLDFWYEDGSRKGEDNVHIAFDWPRQVAVVNNDSGRHEMALKPGALDRGSMQVALMRDLATTGKAGPYLLADEESIADYVYRDNGMASTPTKLGQLATQSLMQQREGSSRSNYIWLAPELKFLPARIEQRRDGEVNSAFTLLSVQGIDKTR
jgi:hypothetical protein